MLSAFDGLTRWGCQRNYPITDEEVPRLIRTVEISAWQNPDGRFRFSAAKPAQKKKLYAYVDESGQDTFGRIFVVSVVVLESEQRALSGDLESNATRNLECCEDCKIKTPS